MRSGMWFACLLFYVTITSHGESAVAQVTVQPPTTVQLPVFGVAVDAEDGHVVCSLVAAVEVVAGWIEVETSRVVAARPFFSDMGELAGIADFEDADAVVQTVARVDELSVARDEDL